MTTFQTQTTPCPAFFSKQSKTPYASNCLDCRLPLRWCICAFAPRSTIRSRLTLLVHQIEWRKSSNTGHLIRRVFPEPKILVQGRPNRQLSRDEILWNDRPAYILFPGRGARPIQTIPEHEKKAGIHLIVPDGNWRQTSSMVKRMAPLRPIKTVMLDGIAPAHRRMRMNISPERMSTFEAIVLALHQIEGRPREQDHLLHFFRLYADRMLMLRGKMRAVDTEQPLPFFD